MIIAVAVCAYTLTFLLGAARDARARRRPLTALRRSFETMHAHDHP
jgi:hypothetical protein